MTNATTTKKLSETKIKFFATSEAAWAFMVECDKSNDRRAGFPSTSNNGGKGYSVAYVEIVGRAV